MGYNTLIQTKSVQRWEVDGKTQNTYSETLSRVGKKIKGVEEIVRREGDWNRTAVRDYAKTKDGRDACVENRVLKTDMVVTRYNKIKQQQLALKMYSLMTITKVYYNSDCELEVRRSLRYAYDIQEHYTTGNRRTMVALRNAKHRLNIRLNFVRTLALVYTLWLR